jgi:hypothetical protein
VGVTYGLDGFYIFVLAKFDGLRPDYIFIFLTHFCWELELIDYGRKLKGAAVTCLSL